MPRECLMPLYYAGCRAYHLPSRATCCYVQCAKMCKRAVRAGSVDHDVTPRTARAATLAAAAFVL